MPMAYLLQVLLPLAAQGIDTVVVCPRELSPALGSWLVHRRAEGRQIAMIRPSATADATRQAIREAAPAGSLRFILLVGDAPSDAERPASQTDTTIPTFLVPSKVVVHWGSEPEIATDNPYSDLDDDGMPDVALGRLSVDSPGELAIVVGKILAFEKEAGHGLWRRKVNLVACTGNFGPLADTALETGARQLITQGIPPDYVISMTYGNWRSPFCPDPRRFAEVARERLSEGCLFWVYIGHGRKNELDRVSVPGGRFRILRTADAGDLTARASAPLCILLSCDTGAFDLSNDCLAEALLEAIGGPVGVLCGSRVTMPYAMAVLGRALMKECLQSRPATIGEALLAARRRSAAPTHTDELGRQIDMLAALIHPGEVDLAAQRMEHLAIFNFLGDPCLRVQQPAVVSLESEAEVAAGGRLILKGTCDVDGTCLIELASPRSRPAFGPAVRSRFLDDPETLGQYDDVYRKANDDRIASAEVPVEGGRFSAVIDVPPSARGEGIVRAFVTGREGFGMGWTPVEVRRRSRAQSAGAVAPSKP
jgi:hypothetical protein